jgi:two-component system, LytTR family, response regulator
MIRALIVDDEMHARDELRLLLEETGGVEVVGSCANALEAVKAINRLRPQVLFLDIQMPLIGGFELLSMIDEEIMPHVVFVTAYDEYALKAFEEKTLDYLLKPVAAERLKKSLEKLRTVLRNGAPGAYETVSLSRIPCASANRIKLVEPQSVEYVHSDLSGVHVVTSQGSLFTELTLKVLEDRTDLLRCHRQFLVNLDQVDEILLLESGLAEIRTKSGQSLPISRRYLKSLKDRLHL